MQLYKEFKEANFTDPAINPYEWKDKVFEQKFSLGEGTKKVSCSEMGSIIAANI